VEVGGGHRNRWVGHCILLNQPSVSEAEDHPNLIRLTQTLQDIQCIHVVSPQEFAVRLVYAFTFLRQGGSILTSVNASVPKLAIVIE
jgi:hypothetical protein